MLKCMSLGHKVRRTRMADTWLYSTLLIPISVLSFYIYKKKRRKYTTSIVLFSRYPQPGVTKTRLIPALGQEGAAYAQLLMTNHIVLKLKELCINKGDVDLELWYNGGTKRDMLYWMKERNVSKARVSVQEQPKGGLGEKLQQAACQSLSQGRQYVIIIGSDIPGISGDIIETAIDKLKHGADMVLGPAADGGYYLVGFSKQAQKHLDSVFKDIEWGTERVFRQQSEKAHSLGINLDVLPQTLHDVDLEEDIPVIEKELGIKRSQLTKWSWSVVIPTLNEEDTIADTLDLVVKRCSDVTCLAEIVICDGGSKDSTERKVKEFSERTEVKIKFIKCRAGRGFQLREGTKHATGDHLLFVHSDSVIPRNYDIAAKKCLLKPGNIAGAYKLAFDAVDTPIITDTAWFRSKLKFIAFWADIRCKKGELPYGDNGLFMSRKTYDMVGGFKELYLLEDVILVEELWKYGHIGKAEGDPMITSARRWRKYGAFKITGLNQCIISAFHLGVHPDRLAKWYYGKDKIKQY